MWWSINGANYWFRIALLKEDMSTVYNCANLDVLMYFYLFYI